MNRIDDRPYIASLINLQAAENAALQARVRALRASQKLIRDTEQMEKEETLRLGVPDGVPWQTIWSQRQAERLGLGRQ